MTSAFEAPSAEQNSRVALFQDATLLDYPKRPPFDPSEAFPEDPSRGEVGSERNRIYAAVRETLELLGLDAAHRGTPDWNPLGDLVRPGGRVVLKPNLVDVKQAWIALGGETILDMVTHGSVLRPLADYAFRAVGPEGRIVIADAPLVHADFDAVVEGAGIREMVRILAERGMPVTLLDLREEFFERWTAERHDLGCTWRRRPAGRSR